MSKIKELLKEQHWMIHDLRDAEEIDNSEEARLYTLKDEATKEWEHVSDLIAWGKKAMEWFERNDTMSGNSFARAELEKIMKELGYEVPDAL